MLLKKLAFDSLPFKVSIPTSFLYVFLLISCLGNISFAQNLEQIGKGEAFKVNGGINVSQVFYTASGIENRRDPFNYFLSGNLNLSLYGWSVPLSFSYSDQNKSFQQPFNQYGLSPTYKWVTLHAGYRSLSFSKYTMNGHLFLGGGADLNPIDKVKISLMYGQLQKPVQYDSTRTNGIPAYRRLGGGMKVTYGNSNDFIDLIIFSAKDRLNSVHTILDSAGILPEDNIVVGMNTGKKIGERWEVRGEYAATAITHDIRAQETSIDTPFKIAGYTPRVSSSFYKAFNTTVQYSGTWYGLGLIYERIDPGYRTLGAYYFNNNLENVSLNSTMRLLNKKLNISARGGVQRNNLDQTDLSTAKRFAGSFNASYAHSAKLTFNTSYSNFQTVTNVRSQFLDINALTPFENLDTLNFRQVSQNVNFNTNYVLGGEGRERKNLNVNLSYQQTNDLQGDEKQDTGAKLYNLNTSFNTKIAPLDLTMTISANANVNIGSDASNRTYGPSISFRKRMLEKKMSNGLSYSYNNAYRDGELTNSVMNLRLSSSYIVQEKHNLNLNLTMLRRGVPDRSDMSDGQRSTTAFNELTVNVGYSYGF